MNPSKVLEQPSAEDSSQIQQPKAIIERQHEDDLFDELFIFDMANNHQGSVEHAKKIIASIAGICKERGCRGAIKFQYRQLDTFIHPDFYTAQEPKHIPRFLSTRLSNEEFLELVGEVKKTGLLTICTPFDEDSVAVIEKHDIDIIKIASCSAQDWPLLERVSKTGKPIVCSTAGCTIRDIDSLVSFFKHLQIPLAVMHCVALYPTKEEDLHLNKIDILKERYPFLPIGFSTHEDPDNMLAVQIAVAKGARLFERHVGVETDAITLNAYSSTPQQIDHWLEAMMRAKRICGLPHVQEPEQREIDSLNSLRRGVYAGRDIRKGETIDPESIFYAMPAQPGQITSGEFSNKFSDNIKAKRDYKRGDPIDADDKNRRNLKKNVYSVIHEARSMLYKARIAIGENFEVELSHHYGIERFDKFGAIIINCVNQKYCKKLIIQVAGQQHPLHYHKLKEETFQVLWGRLFIHVEGEERELRPGDQILLKPGQKHSFSTPTGVIAEEISTTHHRDDSYYEDNAICTEPGFRKTYIEHAQHTFEQYDFL